MEERSLIIYRASAGSGKTYTLVREYLRLLLEPNHRDSRAWNRDRYQEILVATFTNKATAELRERIVRELHLIHDGEQSGILNDILKDVCSSDADKEMVKQILRQRAGEVIRAILFNYSFFRIQTIDSFFQEIVRGFVFELANENAGNRIDLNTQEAVEVALDNTLAELSADDPLFIWLRELYTESLEKGGKAYRTKGIAELAGKMLFTKDMALLLDDSTYTLERIREQAAEFQRFQQETIERIQQYQECIKGMIDGDLEMAQRTSNGALYACITIDPKTLLDKMCQEDTRKVMHATTFSNLSKKGLEAFVTKDRPDVREKLAGKEQLVDLILEYQKDVEDRIGGYATSVILQEQLQMVPFLRSLKRRLDEYQKEHNILLIDEVSGIIQEINSEVDAPVMYEKVGTRITNYLLDEFQDTSSKQWDNFKPLLEEALSGNQDRGDNYLVGDVKQSIYRWREADSSLLNDVVPKEIGEERVSHKTLETNWRSAPAVIDFNNRFFSEIDQVLLSSDQPATSSVIPIYHPDQVIQKVAEKRQNDVGYVHIQAILEPSTQTEITEEDEESVEVDEKVQEQIRKIIDQAILDGYGPSDIAILGRENKDAQKVAEILTALAREARGSEEGYDGRYAFLSDEVLLISNSLLVQFVIQYLRYRAYPSQKEQEALLDLMIDRIGWELSEKVMKLPLHEFRRELKEIPYRSLSLYELVRLILRQINVPKQEEIYINALLDLVLEYGEQQIGTLALFVEWWESYGVKKCVEMGNATEDRIQLITIHKSKGLEYPIVILPYANWQILKKSKPGKEVVHQDQISATTGPHPKLLFQHYLIPEWHTYCLKSSLQSAYRDIWWRAYLDNLNLLYVAFTRASQRLYVMVALKQPTQGKKSTPKQKKVSEQERVSQIIKQRLDTFGTDLLQNAYVLGSLVPKQLEAEVEHTSIQTLTLCDHEHSLLDKRIEKINTTVFRTPEMIGGIELHLLLSQCQTLSDIREGLQCLETRGKLTHKVCRQLQAGLAQCEEQYPDLLHSWLASEKEWRAQYPHLYSRILLNEQTLFDPTTNRQCRPDRIILDKYKDGRRHLTLIDYKFGEVQDAKYRKQIQRYLEALQDYYTEAEAYLWYNLSTIVKVQ